MRISLVALLFFLYRLSAIAQPDSLSPVIQNGFITNVSASCTDNAGNLIIGGDYSSNQTYIKSYLAKYKKEGQFVFNKQVNPDSSLVSLILNLMNTKDGNLLYFGYHFNCDVGPFVYFLEKADSTGQVLWTQTIHDQAVFIKEASDSTIYLYANSKIVHYDSNGDSIGNFTLPGNYFTNAIALGNYYLIQNLFDSIKVVDLGGILLNSNSLKFNINQHITLNDTTIFLANDTSIIKVNQHLQILNQYTYGGQYNYARDLKIIDNQVWLVRNNIPLLYQFDLNLNLLDTINFTTFMDTALIVEKIVDKDSLHFYAICKENNHSLIKTLSKSNYSSTPAFQDASIYHVRCDSTQGQIYNIPGTSLYYSNLSARFFVSVKNNGLHALDSLWINAYLNQNSFMCAPTSYSKKFVLNIQPGDTTELFIGWVTKYFSYSTNQIQICFYSSSPNSLQDLDPMNDSLCSSYLISNAVYVGAEEIEHNKIQVFPNPASNRITILKSDVNNANSSFVITDLYGRIILSDYLTQSETQINIEALIDGIYFYTLSENNNRLQRGKLLIKK